MQYMCPIKLSSTQAHRLHAVPQTAVLAQISQCTAVPPCPLHPERSSISMQARPPRWSAASDLFAVVAVVVASQSISVPGGGLLVGAGLEWAHTFLLSTGRSHSKQKLQRPKVMYEVAAAYQSA
jgi:hypothetical protein